MKYFKEITFPVIQSLILLTLLGSDLGKLSEQKILHDQGLTWGIFMKEPPISERGGKNY